MRIKGNSHIVLSSYELSTAHTVPMRWPSPCVRNKIIYSSTTSSSSSAKKKKKTILSVHYILYLFPSFFCRCERTISLSILFHFLFLRQPNMKNVWRKNKTQSSAVYCVGNVMVCVRIWTTATATTTGAPRSMECFSVQLYSLPDNIYFVPYRSLFS